MKSKFFLLATLMLIMLLVLGCTEPISNIAENGSANIGDTSGDETAQETNYVSGTFILEKDNEIIYNETHEIEKGTNAFDAILELFGEENIEYQEYVGMGIFVNSINGIAGDSEHYWALYINGEYAEKAINAHFFDEDMEVKWVYEEIDLSQLQ